MMRIQVDKGDYGLLIRVLNAGGNGKARNHVKKAVNDTAKEARDMLHQTVRKEYLLKRGKMKKSDLKIKMATVSNLCAYIMTIGPPIKLRDFASKRNGKTVAASAQVKSASSMKRLQKGGLKAFVATMQSGHEGIFQRKGQSRLPIKELYGPGYGKMAEKACEKVGGEMQEALRKHMQEAVERAIGGGP